MFPKHVTQFVISVLFTILLPLAPLAALAEERTFTGIKPEDLLPVAATYTLAIGAASRDMLILILGMVTAFPMIFLYGAELRAASGSHGSLWYAAPVVLMFAMEHLYERWDRHMINREPFLEV
jgi:hypothetical protein